MKTPYERCQLERIISGELARMFAHKITEQQADAILKAKAAKEEADNAYRQAIRNAVSKL